MESVLGRYRNLIVLVGVLFAQVLGLAVQVKRTNDLESTRLIRVWAVGAVTPLEKALLWIQTSTGNVWHNYLYLRGVRAENRELKLQIEQMRIEQARLSQDADQARRLQALLAFKEQFISQTLAAQVIGSSGSEQSRVVNIDKGWHDGVRPDMAVITKDGIVGKVLQVSGARHLEASVSQVLLINDQSSGVGAILEKSRLQGILRGTSSGEVTLEKVMSDESVPVGEQVLTSGGDSIFPKGLPVGTVSKVTTGSDLFLNIRVRPAADLSRLEEVLIVTRIDERQAKPDPAGPMRAVDILAERLPSVPVKPPATGPGNPAASSSPGAQQTSPASSAGVAAKPGSALVASPGAIPASSAPKPAGTGVRPAPSAANSAGIVPTNSAGVNPPPSAVKKAVSTVNSPAAGAPQPSPEAAKKSAGKPANSPAPPAPQPQEPPQ